MDSIKCAKCGSPELTLHEGFYICNYCRSRFEVQPRPREAKTSEITVASDIEALLQKCRDDPNNRRMYASLILDIDPTNPQANQFLN